MKGTVEMTVPFFIRRRRTKFAQSTLIHFNPKIGHEFRLPFGIAWQALTKEPKGRIMKTHLLKLSITLMGALLITGCAGLTTKKVDQAQVKKIRKIAVVAYTANLPSSRKIGLNGNSGKLEGSAGGSMITETSPETDRMYQAFIHSLGQTQKWTVLDAKTMIQNEGYKAAYKKTMDGWQNKMPAASGTTDYVVNSVMDWNGPRLLDFAGREKLIADLGVDAIALLRIDVSMEGFTVMGFGSHKPAANAHLQIFSKGNKDHVWFDTLKGPESEESVGITAFIDEQKTREYSLISAQTAYTKMNSKTEKD